MPKNISTNDHKHQYEPYTTLTSTKKYGTDKVPILVHQHITINCCSHDGKSEIEIEFDKVGPVDQNSTVRAENEIIDLTNETSDETDTIQNTYEEGVCCFCLGECNPCSQACGRCARSRFY